MRALGAKNLLHEPEVLWGETERMLGDPKAARFVEAFAADGPKPTYREWHYAASLIAGKDTTPANPVHGVTAGSTKHLCFANLSGEDATAQIRSTPSPSGRARPQRGGASRGMPARVGQARISLTTRP